MAIEEARQVILNLRPVQYDKLELIPALTNYLKSYETQYQIKTEFSMSGDETTLFPKTKIFLFRIVQEALSNVQQHAKADRVAVRLAITRAALTATITDNGVGFDVHAVSRDPEKWDHFGLRGILERARLVGGKAGIESKQGRGTRVVIEVPLVKKEATRNGTN
jgi:two-component system, NarL family, sensor histidine kinase DegS